MCDFPGCERNFNSKSHLKTHNLIHCRDNLFHCPYCKKAYTQERKMLLHQESHVKPAYLKLFLDWDKFAFKICVRGSWMWKAFYSESEPHSSCKKTQWGKAFCVRYLCEIFHKCWASHRTQTNPYRGKVMKYSYFVDHSFALFVEEILTDPAHYPFIKESILENVLMNALFLPARRNSLKKEIFLPT